MLGSYWIYFYLELSIKVATKLDGARGYDDSSLGREQLKHCYRNASVASFFCACL